MFYKNDFLNIPLELLTFAIQHHKVNQVELYICLKSLYSGQFKHDPDNIELICTSLKCHKKTFHTNLKWLLKHKWVTFFNDYCLIKSFDKVANKIDFFSKKSVLFFPDTDMNNFRPFIYAAIITYYMRLKRIKDKRSGTNKDSSYMKRHPYSTSYDLPNTYLSKILGISKSCASQYKKMAAQAGYITVTKSFEKIETKPEQLNQFKKYYLSDDSVAKKIRIINGAVFIQLPDRITSDLIIKKKRSLKSIKHRLVA